MTCVGRPCGLGPWQGDGCWCHSPAAPDVPSWLSWAPPQPLLHPATSSVSLSQHRTPILGNSAPGAPGAGWQGLLPSLSCTHRHSPRGTGQFLPSLGTHCSSDPPPKQSSALLFIRNTGVIKLCPGAPCYSSLIMFVKSAPFEIGCWCFSQRSLKRNTPQTCAFIQEWHSINCPCVGNAFPGSFILGLFPLFVILFSDINFPYFCFSSVQPLQKGTIFWAFSLFSYVNPYKKIISKCWHKSLPHLNAADEGRKAKSCQKWLLLANIQLIDFLLFC